MRDDYREGFHACEADYLDPLRSRLQVIMKYRTKDYSLIQILVELDDALSASDDKHQWRTK